MAATIALWEDEPGHGWWLRLSYFRQALNKYYAAPRSALTPSDGNLGA